MASKLSKIKLKGQRSVLKLIKDREVTELYSEDYNSDTQSKGKINSGSATRVTNTTPEHKRKERSPQETSNNPHKKINMGDTTDKKRKLEQQLAEEEKEIDSLSPELAKVTKILLRRNEHRFTKLQNDISTLLMNAEVLQEQQNQIETLKRENCEMQLKCDRLEIDHRRLKKKYPR